MLLKRVTLLSFLLFVALKTEAQVYKGVWYGYITMEGFSVPSGYVLHIKEQNGNIVTGRAYIYSNQFFLFHGVLDFIGVVNQNSCKITELSIKSDEFPSPVYSLCIKNLDLTLSKENNLQYLTGNWKAYYYKTWCEPGKVRLKRYVGELEKDQTDSIPRQIIEMMKMDVSPKISFLNTDLAAPVIIDVKQFVVKIEVRDYLKDDRDTVSVYYNRNLIIDKLRIHKKPKTSVLRLEKTSGLNELIMYANNLGLIPPNTSTLTIDDGVKKQVIIITSTKQTSAVVYLRYKPD